MLRLASRIGDRAWIAPKSLINVDTTTENENNSGYARFPPFDNSIVVWLDSNMSKLNENKKNFIVQLQHVVNTVKTFVDPDECVEFITTVNDKKLFLTLTSFDAQRITSFIKDMPQLAFVYVFGNEQFHHEDLTKLRNVKGSFKIMERLCDVLKRDIYRYESHLMPISIIGSNSYTKVNDLDQSFMYSQLIKDIILNMKYDDDARKDFINFLRIHYCHESEKVDEFERDYQRYSPIRWYTKESFIYSELNKALRIQNNDLLIKMGFFIQDIHREIERLHAENNQNEKLVLYRGQGMASVDLDKIKKNEGGPLSFNSLLSISFDNEVSLMFAESSIDNLNFTKILFKIEVDPSISSPPFASLDNISHFSDTEKEVYFQCTQSFGSVRRRNSMINSRK